MLGSQKRTCSIGGCAEEARARGWCRKHYHRWQRYGDPDILHFEKQEISPDGLCVIEDCDKPMDARGWCKMHYARWQRTGTTEPGTLAFIPAEDRFELYIVRSKEGCWDWTGPKNSDGYGRFRAEGSWHYAHRWSWEHSNGRSIPEGMLVRHSCDNPPCANPSHLLIGTYQDNSNDMVERGRSLKGRRRGGRCGESG